MKHKIISEAPSIVWSSELTTSRLDATYYSAKFIYNENKLSKVKTKRLKELLLKGNYGILPDSEDYLENNNNGNGIYLIRGTDLRDNFIEINSLVTVPASYLTEKAKVENEDVLLLIKGVTLDKEWSVSIVNGLDKPAIFNGSIFRCKFNNEVDPYFMTIYMSTDYFLKQKSRAISNTGIYYNDLDMIHSFKVICPAPKIQSYIGNKVRKAEELREEAKLLKEEAEKSLNQFLKLDSLEQKINNVLHIKANYVLPNDMNDRLDSEHYKKKFTILYEHLKELERSKVKVLSLKKIIDEGSYGILPDSQDYGKGELIFIRSTDLNDYMIDLDSCEKVPDKYLTPKATVSPGDILLEIKGAIAGGAIVPDIKTNAIVNGSIFRFRVKNDFNNFYILSVLQSIIGSLQKEQHGANSVISYLSLDVINNLKIPVIDIEKQNEIGDKLKKFVENNMKAKNLIKSAKQDIEDLIEGKFDESKISEGV